MEYAIINLYLHLPYCLFVFCLFVAFKRVGAICTSTFLFNCMYLLLRGRLIQNGSVCPSVTPLLLFCACAAPSSGSPAEAVKQGNKRRRCSMLFAGVIYSPSDFTVTSRGKWNLVAVALLPFSLRLILILLCSDVTSFL